ncbi:pyridoxamine 5'-phosphate oxidase family protein [Solidesulfovibrio sp.]
MEPEAVLAAVHRLLAETTAMTLATVSADAGGLAPWASTVYFAPDGFDLVFLSSPDSRHGRNLAANPACAAAVSPEAASWRSIRGLQLEGRAAVAAGLTAKGRAMAAYFTKFPFVKALLADPGEAARRMGKVSAHVFRPTAIRYLDNSLGFGARWLVRLDDGRPIGPPTREK